jgi:hypothetical protein
MVSPFPRLLVNISAHDVVQSPSKSSTTLPLAPVLPRVLLGSTLARVCPPFSPPCPHTDDASCPVDAKSKFLGKSFEIRPVGVAHVKLRLPNEWAPSYPASSTPGMVEEHYSWTKVTTSISNFIFGSPIIDHIGDMVITNHRTGEVCTLTFKPRGWRGSGASEIKGKVVDKDGREHWDIAGKWSSQLVARRVGAGSGDLAPDANVPTTQAGEVAPEYIRLWKNSEKPVGVPFNL